MSTLSIGRIGLDLDLDPASIRITAAYDRTIVITGEIAPASAAEAITIRNELYRMTEIEGLILPVVFSSDPTLNGYYRLVSAMVDVIETSLSGWYPFSIALDRVGADSRIAIQARTVGGLRVNEHSITTGTYEPLSVAPPGFFTHDHAGLAWTSFTRTTDDGNVTCFQITDFDVDPIFSLPVANYYKGGAKAEIGTTLRVLAGLDCENLPKNWRIGNGLIRVTPNATNGRLEVSHYDGTSWETAKIYQFKIAGTEVGDWQSVSVMKNDPSIVVIRLQAGTTSRLTLDLTLKRGHRIVEGRVNRDVSSTFEVLRNTTEAATAITGGIRATSNDGDGNRYVIASNEVPGSKDTTNGGITSDSQTVWSFFIGSEIGGSGAAAPDDADSLVKQFHGYVAETMNLVIR